MQYLVIGANGYVGSYLYEQLNADGLNVIGTGRRYKGKGELIYFDVLKNSVSDITALITEKEKTAIFCVAQANLEACQTEYELARLINVVSAKEIIGQLVQENFHVIYFSTDNVFDGRKGDYTEQDKTGAVNQYGKLKEETEHFLVEKYPEVCIFRMPRVVGAGREKQNMLTDLESKLTEKEIKCIKDNKMSIIAKEDIYQACRIASQKKLKGLYNLSNGEVYSRKELAEKFYTAMGIFDKEIIELELEEFGFKDTRPLNVGLNNSKFRKETGYEFKTYEMLIKQYLMTNGYKK